MHIIPLYTVSIQMKENLSYIGSILLKLWHVQCVLAVKGLSGHSCLYFHEHVLLLATVHWSLITPQWPLLLTDQLIDECWVNSGLIYLHTSILDVWPLPASHWSVSTTPAMVILSGQSVSWVKVKTWEVINVISIKTTPALCWTNYLSSGQDRVSISHSKEWQTLARQHLLQTNGIYSILILSESGLGTYNVN